MECGKMATPDTAPEAVITDSARLFEDGGKRFVGRATNKVDAKGRVSVPAEMRRFLEGAAPADEPPQIMRAAVAFIGQELWCGGPDLPEVLHDIAKIDGLFPDVDTDYERQGAVFDEIELLRFDENGRVTLPADMRAEAGIGSLVTFAGRGSHFVIGDAEMMNKRRIKRRATMVDNEDILKAKAGACRLSRKGGPAS